MVSRGLKRAHTLIEKSGVDLVSQVAASHRDNFIEPFPIGQKCLREITMIIETMKL